MAEWIPVSRELPNIHNYTQWYLVTCVTNIDKKPIVTFSQYTETNGSRWWGTDNVIAWMPLPEPYDETKDHCSPKCTDYDYCEYCDFANVCENCEA